MSTGQHPKTPDERIDEQKAAEEARFEEIKGLNDEQLEERLQAVESAMNEYGINADGSVFMGVKLDSTVDLLIDLGVITKETANRYFRQRLLQSLEMNTERMIPQIEEMRRQQARAQIVRPGGFIPNGKPPRIDPLA